MAATFPKTERVLIIKHGAFGDVVQIEGALRDLRAHHPDAELVALTTPAYRPILERCPWVDRVLTDAREPRWRLDRMLALRMRLRGERFDRVYDFQNSTRTGTYRRWIFSDLPWSGEAQTRDWLLRIKPPPLASLETLAHQLARAGVTVRYTRGPDVSWMADDVSALLAGAGVGAPFVVLIPGSSARHPEKRWPHYPALARALLAEGFGVVTAPGPDEQALAATIPGRTLMNAERPLNWFELAGLFAASAFVVGNDTGPSHLAAHSGARGLALFGPHTSPERTGIVRPAFTTMDVADLAALSVETVLHNVLGRLTGTVGFPAEEVAPKSTAV